jgi:hypothetical protein
VFSGYNYYAVEKVMLVLNEMTDQERHEMYDILKPLITDQQLEVRQKYRPAYMVPNTVHIFCMTNHERPIRLPDENERRFYIAEAIAKAPQEHHYYDKLFHWFKKHPSQILDHFSKVSLGDWSPEMRPKMTEAKKKVVQLSKLSSHARFEQMLNDDEFQYNLYQLTSFMKLLYVNGAVQSERHFSAAQLMFAKYNIEIFKAARPKPGGVGMDPTKIVCVKSVETYRSLKQAELWREYLSERKIKGDDTF